MRQLPTEASLPSTLCGLMALYFAASLIHFSHNAEYIAFYPNMPAWISRGDVYAAWFTVSALGAVAAILWGLGWQASAVVCLAAYGSTGLDGLAHYSLALCSEHTMAMNLSIWFEALSGMMLAAAAIWHLASGARRQKHAQ